VFDVLADGALGLAEEVGELLLAQPNGLTVQPHVQLGAPVFALVNEELAHGGKSEWSGDRSVAILAASSEAKEDAGETPTLPCSLIVHLLRAAAAQAHPVFDVVVDDEIELLRRESVVGREDGVDLVGKGFRFSWIEFVVFD
jgi:hypothetical protein